MYKASMQEYIYSSSPLLLGLGYILLLFFISLYFLKFNSWKGGEKKKLPPISMGWPFVGHTVSWFYCMAKSSPLAFLHKYMLPYGEIVTCNLFGRPMVVSVDPEFNKFVLENEGRLFKISYLKSFHDLMGKYSIMSVTGDLHRQLHGIAVGLLTNEKLRKTFIPAIQDSLKQSIAEWEGREIVFHSDCKSLFLNLMAKNLLNLSSEIEIEDLCTHLSDLMNGLVSVPIEMFGFAYAKGLKARRTLNDKLCKLIDERRKHPCNDLLSKLVAQENLPNDIVVDFILTLLVGSYETAPRTMTAAIHFLSHSHKALKQLTEEHETIKQCKGNEDKLQWEDYKRMKFTQCVLNETLRLSNVAVGLIRETTQDVTLKGYMIPKGWGVMAFLGGVHINDKFYNDALKFDPWRWQGADKDALLWKNHDTIFSPFGGGRRLCPGADLARITISLFLHYFVTNFRWELVKEGRITYFPIPHVTGGLPIRVFSKGSATLHA